MTVPGKRKASTDSILKGPTRELTKLRQMGLTDHAVMTYVARLQEGQPRERVFGALIQGRALSEEQKQFVREVLDRLIAG
jgi:hypothetical protein